MRTNQFRQGGWLVAAVAASLGALAIAPAPLSAQEVPAEEAQQATHTVRRGDTLWDIARTYLGDPFQWPEIFRINQDVVEDPHWIYPGEVLRVPGRMIVRRTTDVVDEPAVDPRAPTIFAPRPSSATGVRIAGPLDAEGNTVRVGEVIAAPYVISGDSEAGTGRILDSRELRRVAETATSPTEFYSLFEEIHVVPPTGATGAAGERYLVIDPAGPQVDGFGRVITPVGIVEVVQARFGTEAAVARVVRQFRDMRREHRLTMLDTSYAVVEGRPEPVTTRRRAGSIRWIANQHELPSIQSYILTDLTTGDGVRIGDEISLFEPVHRGEPGDPDRPERPIARAQIVRVTPTGSTAVIIGQRQPAIRVGTAVRVIAAMR
jgi:LysM repeat protein